MRKTQAYLTLTLARQLIEPGIRKSRSSRAAIRITSKETGDLNQPGRVGFNAVGLADIIEIVR